MGTPNQAVEDKEDEVKANKNKLNLEPAMNFIKANKEECNSALDRLRKSYNGPISGDGIYSLKIGKSEIGIKIVGSNLIGENKG
ncbi:MAG: hypothetical protein LBC61_05510 [Candidatus Peribacteria bacterium]|nr:hypothetical protein [Candidatus Peribacteria bacterium]